MDARAALRPWLEGLLLMNCGGLDLLLQLGSFRSPVLQSARGSRLGPLGRTRDEQGQAQDFHSRV